MIVPCTDAKSKANGDGAALAAKKSSKRQSSKQADYRAENDVLSTPPLFSHEEWTLFRNLSTLGQKAGVTQNAIPALVAKELVDNALDSSGECRYGPTSDGGLYVEDDGDGLPGTDAEIADLFSVSRPLSTSKLLRLPTRGALGNGLRVVAGAVLASGGTLTVKTHGRALRLRPRDADGKTDVEHVEKWKGQGTRVEVLLGDALPLNGHTFRWANQAAAMAKIDGQTYRADGPWWSIPIRSMS